MIKDKLPADLDAEKAVLGSLLIDSSAINDISLILTPADFHLLQHSAIYDACISLHGRMEAVNSITVAREMRGTGNESWASGAFLTDLMTQCPSALDALDYANIVANLSMMRKLIKAGENIVELGMKADIDTSETLSKANKLLNDLHGNGFKQGIVSPAQASQELLIYIGQVKDDTASISYGFKNLDRITGGIFPGEYIIIGARPSMGKTEFMQQMTDKMVHAGKTGLWISLEMLRQPGLMERWISSSTGIDIKKIRRRELTEHEWAQVTVYACEVGSKPVYFLDGDLNIEQIAAYIRQLSLERKLDYVMLDYVQLIKDCVMGDNMNAAVTKVSRILKNTAKQLQIPIICACQLNRKLEERPDKRPKLADLRESGSLEQDADVVWLLYRDEVYFPESTGAKGITEVKMAKNRQLGTALVQKLTWHDKTRRLYDVDYAHAEAK